MANWKSIKTNSVFPFSKGRNPSPRKNRREKHVSIIKSLSKILKAMGISSFAELGRLAYNPVLILQSASFVSTDGYKNVVSVPKELDGGSLEKI